MLRRRRSRRRRRGGRREVVWVVEAEWSIVFFICDGEVVRMRASVLIPRDGVRPVLRPCARGPWGGQSSSDCMSFRYGYAHI